MAPKLTAVTILVSPVSGSVSLVSTLPAADDPARPLATPPFSVALPVSATAVGAVLVVVDRREYDIRPIIAGAPRTRRKHAGRAGPAIGIDTVGGRGAVSGPLVSALVEVIGGRHIGACGVVGGDVGRVGRNRDRRRQGHRLPAAGAGVGEGRAGELCAGRAPEVKHIRSVVVGRAVELQRRHLSRRRRGELHAQFQRLIVIEGRRRRRRRRGAEQAESSGAPWSRRSY